MSNLLLSVCLFEVEMETNGADCRDEDDDGNDDPHHDGQKGVRLPGVLGSHPAPQMSLTVGVLECTTGEWQTRLDTIGTNC